MRYFNKFQNWIPMDYWITIEVSTKATLKCNAAFHWNLLLSIKVTSLEFCIYFRVVLIWSSGHVTRIGFYAIDLLHEVEVDRAEKKVIFFADLYRDSKVNTDAEKKRIFAKNLNFVPLKFCQFIRIFMHGKSVKISKYSVFQLE